MEKRMDKSNNMQPINSESVVINEVFSGCTGLTSITIPQSVNIAENAFENLANWDSITIPEGVSQQTGPSSESSENANESGSLNPVG